VIVEPRHDRQRDQLKRSLLRSHPLLARCPARVVRRIASIADEIVLAPGDILAEQGRVPQWFFLICSGTAEVTRDGALLGVLGDGEHYGEVPLLGRGVHPVTLRAITRMRAFVIGSQRFVPLVQDVGSLRQELQRALARQAELVVAARAERAKRLRPAPGAPRLTAPSMTRRPTPGVHPLSRAHPRVTPDDAARVRASGRLRGLRAAAIAAAVVSIGVSGRLYHPPFAVVRQGPVIDISHDVAVSGVPAHAPRGRYLLLTVRAERPPLFGLAKAALAGEGRIVHVEGARSGTAAQVQNRLGAEFTQSQQDATTAAAAAFGIARANQAAFRVTFRHREIVGPSAGLIYALAIDDMLSNTDRAHGRVIAATGEVGADGVVKSVSFVREKAIAARRAGAQLLLAPVSQADQAAGVGLPVIGVSSVQEALEKLEGR
jgi:PDZ domain-containing protein